MPWGNVHGEELLRRLECANREHLTQVILQCEEYCAQAIGEIEEALQFEGTQGGHRVMATLGFALLALDGQREEKT